MSQNLEAFLLFYHNVLTLLVFVLSHWDFLLFLGGWGEQNVTNDVGFLGGKVVFFQFFNELGRFRALKTFFKKHTRIQIITKMN